MIERVPIFASLDREAVVEVGKRLRAVVALPGEKIIRIGGPPDSMYFIAAGEVTVHTGFGPVVLKEGDFVGEMGLLSSRPRNADVVANGYCHLLMLSRKDFRALLDKRPAVRAEIEAVAARRARRDRGRRPGRVLVAPGCPLRGKTATNRAIQALRSSRHVARQGHGGAHCAARPSEGT